MGFREQLTNYEEVKVIKESPIILLNPTKKISEEQFGYSLLGLKRNCKAKQLLRLA